MSDIIKPENAAAAEYLSLAAELGVDLTQSAVSQGGSSLYTPWTAPEGVRSTIDITKSDIFKWNAPGEGKDFPEQLFYKTAEGELIEFGPIHAVQGLIVDYSQRDQLDYFVANKVNLICSVIGHGYPNNAVKELPKMAYGNKYTWKKKADGSSEIDHLTPSAAVEDIGLVGQRGGQPTACADCIRSGMSTERYVDDKGQEQTAECQPRGKVHMVIYSVGKISKKKGLRGQEPTEQVEMRDVANLVDENGNPFDGPLLLQLTLSRALVQGKWNKDDAVSIVGMEGYFRNLERNFRGAARKNPLFNLTQVRLKKNPKAPIFNVHFEEKGLPSLEMIREAKALWESSVPVRAAVSLSVSEFDKDTIKSASVVDVPALDSFDEDEDDVLPTTKMDQSPF